MNPTKFTIQPSFFSGRPQVLVQNGPLQVTALRYRSGVCGLKIQNEQCSMVVLPYMGMQIWYAEFCGKNLTMKSIFDEPLATTKYGDNYGALLLHCGITNLGCPPEGEDYPLHGELPFGSYSEVYAATGSDEKGPYISIGGTFNGKNSQEYNYTYCPELRLHQGGTVLEMHVDITNHRTKNPLTCMLMYHINWLAVNGSKLVYSAPHDAEHITVYPTEMSEDTPRAHAIKAWYEKLAQNPTLGDILDEATQAYDPEMCINYKYLADKTGWAHAMQLMPEGDACYVGFRTAELPYALRWLCRTGDEEGVGVALPSTGNHLGTQYQKENGLYHTIQPGGSLNVRFDFGYLPPADAQNMQRHIQQIIINQEA